MRHPLVPRLRIPGLAGRLVAGLWAALVASLGAATLAGCTSHSKLVDEPAPPPAAVQVLAVGIVDSKPTEWQRPALRLQRRLIGELRKAKVAAAVRSSVPQAVPPEMLVVSGRLIDADGGSDLMLLFLGEWFGGPAAAVELSVADAAGRVLYRFSDRVRVSESVLDPTQSDPADLDQVVDELAVAAASSIARWLAGRPYADSVF